MEDKKKKLTLYDMSEEGYELFNQLEMVEELDDETKEQILNDTLEGLGYDEKIQQYIYIIKEYENKVEFFKKEKKRIDDRQRAAENRVKWLKENIKTSFLMTGRKKMDVGTFTVGLRNSESVNITNEDEIPEGYYTIKTEKSISKADIKKAIKNNESVPGAELVTTQSITIR